MDIRRRLENHYRRWNINFDEEEQFRQLGNRVRSVLASTIGQSIAENTNIDKEFAEILGEDVGVPEYFTVPSSTMRSLEFVQGRRKKAFGATRVCEAIDNSEDLKELVTVLQVVFLLLEKYEYKMSLVNTLVKRLRCITGVTPQLEFRIACRGTSVTVYPAGVKALDDGSVNDVLGWLSSYPEVAKPFERALKIYMKGEKESYRNLFDDLRLALEQLLKRILGNEKSLENQQESLLRWIRDCSVHQQVVNMYKQLLFGPYRLYQNQAVKHGEQYSEKEAEFMIYLTGTFMRLLLQLAETKST